ncbi:MAG: phospho-N-acetylmuramoyl-pentapeptide-transferase [Cytophagales bacterium]|nr:phospho-N-acetylmuramoyl-pentapeptide-transferase [Armatimonadota bacterium]
MTFLSPLVPVALPFLLSLLTVLALGNRVIAWLADRKAAQPVSGDAPKTHLIKHGTPTMGGLLIIAAVVVSVAGMMGALGSILLTHQRMKLLAVLGTFVFAGMIGLADDLGKARKKQNKAGLSEGMKLTLQIVVAIGFAAALALTAPSEPRYAVSAITIAGRSLDLGIAYYILGVLFISGFGNAVNFTDGLDGLASGTTLIVSLSLAAVVLLTGGTGQLEMVLFYGAIAGGCAGFLWFNAYPARVFMGDTGSLALGMGISAAALAAKQEILLLIVGAVYLAEIGSMLLQRYVFKYRRIRHGLEYAQANRVFRRAPLHHHFEELGVKETQVVARFWIAALVAAAVGLLLAPLLLPEAARGIGR